MRIESVEKKSVRPSVDGKYTKDYLKHEKEKRFLIYINVAIYSSRVIKENKKWQSSEKDEPNFALKPGNTSLNKKETVTNTTTNQDLQKIRHDTYFLAP